ncbi:MAG TPA: sigma 54-interacting transcriptional regulator [Syntrophomonadaceae bacterium]|nr:sigma 54-interacting transcriptional regulator [Syntrophomonadaceae bacterium]
MINTASSSHPLDINLTYDEMLNVIQESYDGILVTDAMGNVVMVNDSYLRIIEHDVAGKNFPEYLETIPYRKAACLDVLKKKARVNYTHFDLVPGKTISVTSTPIFDDQGQIRLVVTNVRDMTEMMQLKEQLEKAREMENLYYQHLDGLNQPYGGPIAVNHKMKELFAAALKVSPVDITVLITGESGVGKEVVAKYIHEHSNRKSAPFIAVNCGAIPEPLLESEFFGYVGGAFTGASKSGKKGLFESAEGGTLFLDEIGDLPFNLQVKLLRALDNGEITKVGANSPIPVNIRLLAATNQDLEQMVKQHKFREDLYYRLNVVNLQIPPLRERPEDIRPLCMYFLHHYNKRYGQGKRISLDVLRTLENFSWPGNIRQLKNSIEHMVVLSNGEYLELDSLPCFCEKSQNHKQIDAGDAITINHFITIPQAVEEVEKQILSKALTKFSSSRQIAKSIGIDQTTVLRKIKKYGLRNSLN